MATMILLDLMGAVALLLWGLHLVRTGIVRAFGSNLRRVLGTALRNRFIALLAGLGTTALLQSSTATALMATSFAAGGLLDLVPALAIMLGANVGTTLIVQVLSFNVSAAAPLFFLLGFAGFTWGKRTWVRDLGRVAIGLGLILIGLHMLVDTLAPAEDAPGVHALLAAATSDPLLCLVIAGVLTWAAHSSAAIVLLVMSLAYSHFVTPAAALALVLGANIGAAVTPVLEGGIRGNPATRRVPIGNLFTRVLGAALVFPFSAKLAVVLASFETNAARMTADFHTAFNVAFALVFIGLLDQIAAALIKFLPDRKQATDPAAPLYLDEGVIGTPPLALAAAARETLHMGDLVKKMLGDTITALMTGDRKLVAAISRMDNAVDRLHEAIKLYVTKVTRESLDDQDGRRAMEIISFSINLEHIGDIIDKNLMELATKKMKHNYAFSKEGAEELKAFHARVLDNLKLAFGVFMSGDPRVARALIEEKVDLRAAEVAASENHFARLREGRPESIDSSSLHLDVLRDLKRIHSHICSVAYPVLEAAGELQPSRLTETSLASLQSGTERPGAQAPELPLKR